MNFAKFSRDVGLDAGIIRSYDMMLLTIVESIKDLTIGSDKAFKNVHIVHNNKRYRECMDTLSNYECDIVADGSVVMTIPVPVGSCYKPCEPSYVTRGSFVIEGRAKVLMCQEKNYTFRYLARKEKCEFRHAKCQCEVHMEDGVLKTYLSVKNAVNVLIVMRSLGIPMDESKAMILSWTRYTKEVSGILLASQLDVLAANSSDSLCTEGLFATLDNGMKATMLSLMICIFIETILSLRQADDRDCLSFKRVDTPVDIVKRCIMKEFEEIHEPRIRGDTKRKRHIINMLSKITLGLRSNFKTDMWKGYNYTNEKRAISQALSTKSSLDSLSHIRRVEISSKERATAQMRQIHASQLGYICPCETPEGADVGTVKYLSSTCIITPEISEEFVLNCIQPLPSGKDILFINGLYIARTSKDEIFRHIKDYKRSCELAALVSIYYSADNEIHIQTTRGRYSRPLLVCKDGEIDVSKDKSVGDMCRDGTLEMVDATEQMQCFIATDIEQVSSDHTHVEIHPSLIFGLSTSTVPYANFNQSSRIVFQSSMSKQAMPCAPHLFASSVPDSKVLACAQKSICNTIVSDNIREYNGINVIIAVMSYSGYNQEDSLLFNKSAIERGLFSSTKNDIVEIVENRFLNERLVYIPDGNISRDDDGVVLERQKVSSSDTICAKLVTTGGLQSIEKILLRNVMSGIVDKVTKNKTSEGNRVIRVRISSYRYPIVGDKITSRHSQKGVIGCIIPQEDLPFTLSGTVPDIIINPHAIPNRMTIGHLLEMVMSKMYVVDSNKNRSTLLPTKPKSREDICVDATAFNKPYESISNHVDSFSKEKMYCGTTGTIIDARVAIGVCYYHALRHQAKDKAHSISTGVIQSLTKQPVEGRSRKGDLRFGEMEKDCLIAHGASSLLLEKLRDTSDLYNAKLCSNCGMICSDVPCINCGSDNVKDSKIPYSFKLLVQELSMANIRIGLKEV